MICNIHPSNIEALRPWVVSVDHFRDALIWINRYFRYDHIFITVGDQLDDVISATCHALECGTIEIIH